MEDKEREKKVKKARYYMILQWDLTKVDKNFEFQRFEFKSARDILEAVVEAQEFAKLLNNVGQKSREKLDLVKVVAVYKHNAFKDWTNEPMNRPNNDFIKQTLATVRDSKANSKNKKTKPISYVDLEKMKAVR